MSLSGTVAVNRNYTVAVKIWYSVMLLDMNAVGDSVKEHPVAVAGLHVIEIEQRQKYSLNIKA